MAPTVPGNPPKSDCLISGLSKLEVLENTKEAQPQGVFELRGECDCSNERASKVAKLDVALNKINRKTFCLGTMLPTQRANYMH